jgi:2',3'-cyclic-nucleotide 2'-phosphodiesterase (5'-nucleotidase family)
MPFENRVVRLRMRGRGVRAVLEASGGAGALQVSGARVGYRRGRRRRGERIAKIEIGGKPLREDRLYTVAVPDYMVERDSSVPFELAENRETGGRLVREIMAGCARGQGRIKLPVPGRIYQR